VSNDPNAIGYISLGLVDIGEKPVKPLCLNGVAPTYDNARNGSYDLTRPFLLVMREAPSGLAEDFIDFVLSEAGRRILRHEGLIVQ
jgi:phosphate transport system substrate-binding protein